jgi:hypothetical protein
VNQQKVEGTAHPLLLCLSLCAVFLVVVQLAYNVSYTAVESRVTGGPTFEAATAAEARMDALRRSVREKQVGSGMKRPSDGLQVLDHHANPRLRPCSCVRVCSTFLSVCVLACCQSSAQRPRSAPAFVGPQLQTVWSEHGVEGPGKAVLPMSAKQHSEAALRRRARYEARIQAARDWLSTQVRTASARVMALVCVIWELEMVQEG